MKLEIMTYYLDVRKCIFNVDERRENLRKIFFHSDLIWSSTTIAHQIHSTLCIMNIKFRSYFRYKIKYNIRNRNHLIINMTKLVG